MWMLNERLVPVYLHHRYAIEAATKAIGGMEYTFALRGDGANSGDDRRPGETARALTRADRDDSAERARDPGADRRRDSRRRRTAFGGGWAFDSPAGIVFDPLAIARALSSYVADGILAAGPCRAHDRVPRAERRRHPRPTK